MDGPLRKEYVASILPLGLRTPIRDLQPPRRQDRQGRKRSMGEQTEPLKPRERRIAFLGRGAMTAYPWRPGYPALALGDHGDSMVFACQGLLK